MSQRERLPRTRTYLMCPPEHFTVYYAINPWMDTTAAVDPALALKQWQLLRDTLTDLGHAVHVLDPKPACPTWCTPRTAPSQWTAPCTARGSDPPNGRPRRPTTPCSTPTGRGPSSTRCTSTRVKGTSPTCPARTAA